MGALAQGLQYDSGFAGDAVNEIVSCPAVVHFSVIRKGYIQSRTVPIPLAASFRMSPDDVCVSVHQCEADLGSEEELISARLKSVRENPVMVLTRLGVAAALRPHQCFKAWLVKKDWGCSESHVA